MKRKKREEELLKPKKKTERRKTRTQKRMTKAPLITMTMMTIEFPNKIKRY